MGIVIGVGDKSFTVLVPDLGMEARVYLDDTQDKLEFKGGEEEAKLNGTKCISVVPTSAHKSAEGLAWSVLKVKLFQKVSVQVRCRDEPPVDVKLFLNGPWLE
jgi:hypothetical protein